MSPPNGGSHSFEARLASATPGIVTASQAEPGQVPPISQVMLIADELLVASSSAPTVQAYLTSHHVKFARLATLLQGIKKALLPPGIEDVEVWRLLPPHPPVIKLVQGLWAGPLAGNPRAVTPNHVLVPASWADSCPFGPPLPTTATVATLHHGGGAHNPPVTVIDAGFQWDSTWPGNPLNRFANVTPNQGQHPVKLAPLVATTGPVEQAILQGRWAGDSLDKPDADGNGRLDALAGHANFVTGVLGQFSSFPDVSLWNHFGGFYPDRDEYIRELSVCRSLILSHLRTHNPLINLGFSFVPLKQTGKEHVLTIAWESVFKVLGTNTDRLRVITPAGNQGSSVRHYPAAMNLLYPGSAPNVMGVASHDASSKTPSVDAAGAKWSNHGTWVTCSTVGSDVTSTFLHVSMPTEDDIAPHPARDFSVTNLASWSGTCFAAPKITGAIAEQHAVVGSLDQAWKNVVNTTNHSRSDDLGTILFI